MLAEILGVSVADIELTLASKDGYSKIKFKKRSGGYRTVYRPPEPLKRIQLLLLRIFFPWFFNMTNASLVQFPGKAVIFGLRNKTGSFFHHAEHHKTSEWFFQIDLKDAFPSADIELIRRAITSRICFDLNHFLNCKSGAFREGKADTKKSPFSKTTFFSRMNAETALSHQEYGIRLQIAEKLADLIIELTTFQGILPQGTSTASFLFWINLKMANVLGKIRFFLKEFVKKQNPCSPRDNWFFRVSMYADN
ncbi:MAG: hypothetical protein NTY04_04575, partial [Candidatus Staskawiczbacteria bacterium]|nr:hypothetical protein [Candidatus Staskawiczbacteria bacterium]